MARANVHERESIARAYPPDAFARAAAQNDRPQIEVLHGVRITAAPDADGFFGLEPAVMHAGEAAGPDFLAPFHRRTAKEHATADPDPHLGYHAFLDEIAAVAERNGFAAEDSPGRGDARLRGERQ